jgi:acetyl esterase/lipase
VATATPEATISAVSATGPARSVKSSLRLAVLAPASPARPSAAIEPAVVSNTLTYTPGPTLTDRITIGILHVFRAVSNVIGVDMFAAIGKAMENSSPPFFLKYGLATHKTTYTSADGTNWVVYAFQPPDPSGKAVIALHGGGFIDQPEFLHWIDYTNMARETGATVIVPLYPLAKTEAGSANVLIPEMADFVSAQIDKYGAENVSIYGDSAGSTIAMATMRQLILDDKPLPSSMVLLSLAPDFSSSNPDDAKVDDPIFDIHNLSAWQNFGHWTDGIADVQHSILSPLYYDPAILAALPPTTIYMGQNEITYPDALLLYQEAVQDDSPISVVVGTGLVHDWPLTGTSFSYSQAAVVRPAIYRQLGLTATSV